MRRLLALTATLLVLLPTPLPTVAALQSRPVVTPATSPLTAPQADLAGVGPLPLDGARAAAFGTYVADLMTRANVPGAAVAVVQGREVVFAQGFGVKELGGADLVTPDTLMMVGSVTKPMTSTMAAALVDTGELRWDTPLTELLPEFAAADPDLTERLVLADAFCACTGLPRQDLELLFDGAELTAEELVASVAHITPTAPFGQAFQYSNQMFATGGYAAAATAGGTAGGLHAAYVAAMHQHVLDPLGMDRSSFAFAEASTDGDHATPHARDITGAYRPLPLAQEEAFVSPVAPAGGLWSSAREMARYLQTQIGRGVTPDGARVVSAENLEATWTRRVATPPEDFPSPALAAAYGGYGLGWVVGDYKGQPMLSHTGTTHGFAAHLAAWPEAALGVIVLTNGKGAEFAAQAVQFRLVELLYGQPAELEPLAAQAVAATAERIAAVGARLGDRVDPAALAPYLGRYRNPVLGEVSLTLRDGEPVLDAGEVRSALRPRLDEQGRVAAYVTADAPLAPLPVVFRQGAGGAPNLVVPNPATGGEYVFEPAPGSPPGTPSA